MRADQSRPNRASSNDQQPDALATMRQVGPHEAGHVGQGRRATDEGHGEIQTVSRRTGPRSRS